MVINGLIFGLISTLHCVGMCGPLALAVPSKVKTNKWLFAILYQMGRISVYILLGMLAFTIGFSFSLFKVQQYMTIVFGALLVVYALLSYFKFHQKSKFGLKYSQLISKGFGSVLNLHPVMSSLSLGIMNGLLPCGAIYLAAIYASGFTNAYDAIFYMFLFGLGTMPVFIAAWLFTFNKFQFNIKKLNIVYKLLPLLIGVLMILRGSNLGIPYLSPELNESQGKPQIENCCKPSKK